ncbi:MAG TPA: hypothetical protein VKI99_00995 [Candidatus Dormibacteraeota bacterium]|nr:hypothetical protein [Candidatus Dormibacteraeota bacterium]
MGTDGGGAMWNNTAFRELFAAARRYGWRSWVTGVTIAATVAAFLSAAGVTMKLWFYVALAVGGSAVSFAVSALGHPRYRFKLLTLGMKVVREGDKTGPAGGLHLVGGGPRPALAPVALGRAIDFAYEAGFRRLLADADPWIAVIPSSPRDVSKPHELVYRMFAKGQVRTQIRFQPGEFGIPVETYAFERELSEGTHDADHMLAVKDLIYLPHLYRAIYPEPPDMDVAEPFIWPEHCVDPPLLAARNIVLVGGGDTNFWHGAVFEAVWRKFAEPPSTIPLAMHFRHATAGGGRYDSRGLNVSLAGELPGAGRGENVLDERLFPTYAMILGCDNPFSTRTPPHRCVFVAGTRSLGTGGAVLALAAVAANIRHQPGADYWSLVSSVDDKVRAGVSALLCRVTRVQIAWRRIEGHLYGREQRSIPTDRPDPFYSDTAVPAEVEFLDNRAEPSVWRALVRSESLPRHVGGVPGEAGGGGSGGAQA